jgi:hypothetical protein
MKLVRRFRSGAKTARLGGRGERPGQDNFEGHYPVEPDVLCSKYDTHGTAARQDVAA